MGKKINFLEEIVIGHILGDVLGDVKMVIYGLIIEQARNALELPAEVKIDIIEEVSDRNQIKVVYGVRFEVVEASFLNCFDEFLEVFMAIVGIGQAWLAIRVDIEAIKNHFPVHLDAINLAIGNVEVNPITDDG